MTWSTHEDLDKIPHMRHVPVSSTPRRIKIDYQPDHYLPIFRSLPVRSFSSSSGSTFAKRSVEVPLINRLNSWSPQTNLNTTRLLALTAPHHSKPVLFSVAPEPHNNTVQINDWRALDYFMRNRCSTTAWLCCSSFAE